MLPASLQKTTFVLRFFLRRVCKSASLPFRQAGSAVLFSKREFQTCTRFIGSGIESSVSSFEGRPERMLTFPLFLAGGGRSTGVVVVSS